MTEQLDFVVIGAGIAGASVSARLACDASVALLEMEERPGYHSTGRSAASWIENYGNDVIVALNRASFGFLSSPPDGFTEQGLLKLRGVLWTALHGQEASLQAQLTDDVVSMSAQEAVALVPALDVNNISRFAFEQAAYDIDVASLHQGFIRQMKQAGGSLHCGGQVTAINRCGNRWRVSTDRQSFETAVVVNAAGAWADDIAVMAGVKPFGLVPKRRSAALVQVPEAYDTSEWPMVVDTNETVYFRPDSGALMMSPADETPVEAHDVWADDLAIAEAAETFAQMMQFSVNRVTHTWAGLRTFAADKTPVVGMDAIDGFFWLAGQGGYGIQTSPAMASLASGQLLGNSIDPELSRYGVRPEFLSPHRKVAQPA